jgi:uncharacterized membrane protein (GlpM family)|tara:strand:+ start:187 stop:537 length:351 start_codon:yes stop_codon:yes gene_type:complete
MYLILKILLTSLFIILISEISRRSTWIAGLLASIPLTSVLAIIWIYIDRRNLEEISVLSNNILIMIPPSLTFFALLPILLKFKLDFFPALFLSLISTAAVYFIYIYFLGLFEIRLK